MLLTFGDSVAWGQGLLEEHKFDDLFADQRGLQRLPRKAHSGAIIGAPTDASIVVEDGEIPVSAPSIWQQILAPRDWSQVDIVLLDGGINDVSLTRILNPLLSETQIKTLTDQFCMHNMQGLLEKLATLVSVGTRIGVVGYYPILSDQSDPGDEELRALLELHGVAATPTMASAKLSIHDVVPTIVANCLMFWNESNVALQTAVDGANQTAKRNCARFVELPFSEENALWAQDPLLWELKAPLLAPEDEVSSSRGATCKAVFGGLLQLPKLLQCERASVGHPNVKGAATIADTLLGAL